MNIFGNELSLLNPLGWYAFLALIPFILIYLIRPKTLTQTIPSLMFFMKEQKKAKAFSFLQRLLNNILFILQLLAILLLAFALLNPSLTTTDKATQKNTFVKYY